MPAVAVVEDDGTFCGALTPDALRLIMELKKISSPEPEPEPPAKPKAPGLGLGGGGGAALGGLAAARRDSGGWGAMKAGMKLVAIASGKTTSAEEKSPNAECTPVVERKIAAYLAALFCEPVKQVLRYLYEEPWVAVGHNHTVGGCVVNSAVREYGHLDRIHVLNNRKLVGVLLVHDVARLILETQLSGDPASNRLPAKRRQSTLEQTSMDDDAEGAPKEAEK